MKEYYNKFRDDENRVKSRMRKYIRYFKPGNRVVDIGCGRGEFLELLKEKNIEGIGIEADSQMIDICRSKGLKVKQEDIFIYLDSISGMDGMIASHIMEHMDALSAERIIKLSYGVLNHGGRLLIITPNPESMNVITKTFWLDTTHVRYYPLELLIELVKDAGFKIVVFGGDTDTIPNIRFSRLRDALAKLTLKILGLFPLIKFTRAPDDIFIICEKE